MGPRARWETTPEAPGLQLAYTDEICSPLSLDHIPQDTFPIQQLHVSSCGISFATFASFEKISNIRTNAACLVILAGYVKAKVQHLGVEDSRIQYTTITVKDVIQGCEEMRAVTLVNLACDTDDFFSTPNIQPEVEVACIARVAMFAEIRQCDAASADWTAFGNTESFHSYVCQILERHSDLQGSVLYKIFQREGYLCRRLQVPEVHRDAIYSQSGLKSLQFRAVRKPDDPPEAGLEVLKVSTQEGLAETATWLQTVRGGLGCFKSQNALYFRVQDQRSGQNTGGNRVCRSAVPHCELQGTRRSVPVSTFSSNHAAVPDVRGSDSDCGAGQACLQPPREQHGGPGSTISQRTSKRTRQRIPFGANNVFELTKACSSTSA